MSNENRVYKAFTGSTLNCKGWVQEAALRMLMNNLDPEVAEEPAAAEPPVEVVAESIEASFEVPETRVGKKIAASTQAQINEGMDMIQNGYKIIKSAVAGEAGRSITLNMPKKLNTDELLNLI